MLTSRLPFAVPLALVLALAAAAPVSADTPEPRLAGATEVDPPGKYPFVAALVDRYTADAWRGRFCDGAVVGDRWVLTAARCLEDRRPADVDVVVGRHDLTSGSGWRVAAVAFYIHPRHDGANLYDAALIELAAPVSVTPAALPAADPHARAGAWSPAGATPSSPTGCRAPCSRRRSPCSPTPCAPRCTATASRRGR